MSSGVRNVLDSAANRRPTFEVVYVACFVTASATASVLLWAARKLSRD